MGEILYLPIFLSKGTCYGYRICFTLLYYGNTEFVLHHTYNRSFTISRGRSIKEPHSIVTLGNFLAGRRSRLMNRLINLTCNSSVVLLFSTILVPSIFNLKSINVELHELC